MVIKTAKQILIDSVDGYRRLYSNRTARALLTHRNTSVQGRDMSPAMMLYGRVNKDHLLALWDKYRSHKQWNEISQYWEKAMAKRHIRNEGQYNKHSHLLQEIEVGQPVQIQKQTGPYPCRWEKTGRVVEALNNRQYHVRVDGSNRVTYVIFWVVGEKCVWLQNKERIDTHNNTVMML